MVGSGYSLSEVPGSSSSIPPCSDPPAAVSVHRDGRNLPESVVDKIDYIRRQEGVDSG